MWDFSGFIETYGTQAAQELLDFAFIKKCKINTEEARNLMLRWKVIKKSTKYVYNYSFLYEDGRIQITFQNGRGWDLMRFQIKPSDIESLRATLYADRGERIA